VSDHRNSPKIESQVESAQPWSVSLTRGALAPLPEGYGPSCRLQRFEVGTSRVLEDGVQRFHMSPPLGREIRIAGEDGKRRIDVRSLGVPITLQGLGCARIPGSIQFFDRSDRLLCWTRLPAIYRYRAGRILGLLSRHRHPHLQDAVLVGSGDVRVLDAVGERQGAGERTIAELATVELFA